MIVAESVKRSFGPSVALADASATVEPGEVVALVGPSGSGKTTLLYCLAGLLRPDSGVVTFRGRDLAQLDDDERSLLRLASCGFVFQFAELVPELTLRENIALPLDLLGVPRGRRRSRVEELLERLSLTEQADRRPAQVSGGQAQRAAVARAVAHNPEVIFADEPTGSLDSANSAVVIEMMMTLAREHSCAVVMVTHDSGLASQADRILNIEDGVVRHPRTPAAPERRA